MSRGELVLFSASGLLYVLWLMPHVFRSFGVW